MSLGGFQFLELRSTLPDELLMYADKLSMAHGLEVRVPYLDRDIVEYALNGCHPALKYVAALKNGFIVECATRCSPGQS